MNQNQTISNLEATQRHANRWALEFLPKEEKEDEDELDPSETDCFFVP